jgi:4-diphosphocytidyl-2-C-methyl-D-erythritol kinase
MRARAFAKINLGLVVGPLRLDGKHEVVTVLQRVDLHDVLDVERTEDARIVVEGFPQDTLVRRSLELLGESSGMPSGWHVRLEKRIPLAAGLGGGSSDAATALRVGNELIQAPLSREELHAVAAQVGSDVPFFLTAGAKLATGDGTELESVTLPEDYWVVLALPHTERKESTASVYRVVEGHRAAAEFEQRRRSVREALRDLEGPRQLGELPRNDLAQGATLSALGAELAALGAFRADVSGAGPTVYGLFELEEDARRAERSARRAARTWLTRPIAGP